MHMYHIQYENLKHIKNCYFHYSIKFACSLKCSFMYEIHYDHMNLQLCPCDSP